MYKYKHPLRLHFPNLGNTGKCMDSKRICYLIIGTNLQAEAGGDIFIQALEAFKSSGFRNKHFRKTCDQTLTDWFR
jgi:hypothetical protein